MKVFVWTFGTLLAIALTPTAVAHADAADDTFVKNLADQGITGDPGDLVAGGSRRLRQARLGVVRESLDGPTLVGGSRHGPAAAELPPGGIVPLRRRNGVLPATRLVLRVDMPMPMD